MIEYCKNIFNWVLENKEWIFEGVGVFFLSLAIGLFIKNNPIKKQTQKSGNKSNNYQAGGDIILGKKDD